MTEWDGQFYVNLNNLYSPGEGERLRQVFDGHWIVEHPDGGAELVHPIEFERRYAAID